MFIWRKPICMRGYGRDRSNIIYFLPRGSHGIARLVSGKIFMDPKRRHDLLGARSKQG